MVEALETTYGSLISTGSIGAGANTSFMPSYGSIIVETKEDLTKAGLKDGTVTLLGKTIADREIRVLNAAYGDVSKDVISIPLAEVVETWEDKLKEVFPRVSGAEVQPELPEWATKVHKSLSDVSDRSPNKTRQFILAKITNNCARSINKAIIPRLNTQKRAPRDPSCPNSTRIITRVFALSERWRNR